MADVERSSLVTGGAGFLGGHLVEILRERGEDVRVLDVRDPPGRVPGVTYLRGSVADEEAVAEAVDGAGRVFHLAAKTDLWAREEEGYERVNRRGARTVFRESLRAGVDRVVHTSTEAVLRDFGGRGGSGWAAGPAREEEVNAGAPEMGEGSEGGGPPPGTGWLPDPDEVPGPYCRSKALGEREARSAMELGLPVVVVNPTVPMGPGDPGRTPPSRMLLGFLDGSFPAYTDGVLDIIDVRDLARGLLLAAERGEVGDRYVLGGEKLPVRGLLETLEELTGISMPRLRAPYPVALSVAAVAEFLADHVTHRPPSATVAGVRLARAPSLFDGRASRSRLGLAVRPLRETLADTVRWFRDEGLLRHQGHAG